MKHTMLRFSFLFIFILALPYLYAGTDSERLILSVDKANYSAVEQAVSDAGGIVHIKHKFCEGMAVTLPAEKIQEISARGDVKSVTKDYVVSRPVPQRILRDGQYALPLVGEMEATEARGMTSSQMQAVLHEGPQNYFPYSNQLTGADRFSTVTGHYGENVVVAIIDEGVSSAASAVSSRIVGAENFTGDGIPGDSPLNGSHGTWVACCVGANGLFGFGNPAVQNAIKAHIPDAVIPDFFAPGVDGIPMVGQAPAALFYSLKVFPASGGGAPRSVIAAAYERALELKFYYDNGFPGGVDIRIVNMSLGGVSLFAGNDPFYAPLAELANLLGVLTVVSASNDGPAGMSIGAPGDAKNILTVGATDDALYERIVVDLFFAPGLATFWRPVDNHQVALFSSRGPTADGRYDPEIVAPGSWRFAQGASGTSINWVSGTSFSAPTVSGAAALLMSAFPAATTDEIRGALMRGANRKILSDNPGRNDQGYGFLNVMRAKRRIDAGTTRNPSDRGPSTESIYDNIKNKVGRDFIQDKKSTDWLMPGQTKNYYFNGHIIARRIKVTISNVQTELPPAEQNQLFGDDLYVAIHSAKTSGFSDYRAGTPAFVGPAGATFYLEESDLDLGFIRISVCGDWTNAGKVSADVTVEPEKLDYFEGTRITKDYLNDGESKFYSVEVPAGTSELKMQLVWGMDWFAYPTNDLDMLVIDPDGFLVLLDNDGDFDFDGISLDSPERLRISDPMPGTWTVIVDGFNIWNGTDGFKLFADLVKPQQVVKADAGKSGMAAEIEEVTPEDFHMMQNYPNPFNPATTISYQLPEQAGVVLNIYNITGQLVRSLINENRPAGYHKAIWDGRDNMGRLVPTGTYIYRIDAGSYKNSYKMVLAK